MLISRSLLTAGFFALFAFQSAKAQFTVPDPALVTKLQFFVPNAMTGSVLDTTHADVLNLEVLPICCAGITDLSGVEFFTGLEELRANNNSVTVLNELPPQLKILNLRINQLTSLPQLPNTLEELVCSVNALTSLPALPGSLKEIDCTSNQIGSLPVLPPALEDLYCGINPLYTLPTLPATLRRLGCVADSLTTLPTLPATLWTMDCSSNQLTSLPALPASLEYLKCTNNDISGSFPVPPNMKSLDCRFNPALVLSAVPATLTILWCDDINISALPALPNGLESLSCAELGLTSLPSLPDSLRYLLCADNQISTLPALPPFMDRLHCENNLLTVLPSIPGTMEQLTCQNNAISCLPVLPNGLQLLKCTGNSLSCLPNIPLDLDTASSELGFPLVVCNVNTAPCPIMQEAITGTVFNDMNGNGIMDTGEPPFVNAVIEATPGNYLTAPDNDGEFTLPITTGTFTLDGQDVLYHTRTTSPANITLTTLQIDSLNYIGYQEIPGVYDLVVEFHAGAARPGFDNYLHLNVKNIGTEATMADIDLSFDADQDWVTSSVAPGTLTATDASWSTMMMPGDEWEALVTLNTPVNTALGTVLDHLFSAVPSMNDTTPNDNSNANTTVVVGSFDPNDKVAAPAMMTPMQVQNGEYIEYTIRFQNTGTYPAERVVITDTLSTDLLWNTMQFVSASHTNTWYMNEGVLHFVFDPIFLPDSVSDEPNSHGFVKFRMKPLSTLLNGAQIENVANIYFDFNEPVITDPAIFEVSISADISEIEKMEFEMYPNPTNENVTINSDKRIERVQVFQLDGRIVQSKYANALKVGIDTQGLAKGVYVVNVSYANEKSSSQLLMVE